jgi:hypothetical protein
MLIVPSLTPVRQQSQYLQQSKQTQIKSDCGDLGQSDRAWRFAVTPTLILLLTTTPHPRPVACRARVTCRSGCPSEP